MAPKCAFVLKFSILILDDKFLLNSNLRCISAEKSQICLRHAMPNFMWCLDFFFSNQNSKVACIYGNFEQTLKVHADKNSSDLVQTLLTTLIRRM